MLFEALTSGGNLYGYARATDFGAVPSEIVQIVRSVENPIGSTDRRMDGGSSSGVVGELTPLFSRDVNGVINPLDFQRAIYFAVRDGDYEKVQLLIKTFKDNGGTDQELADALNRVRSKNGKTLLMLALSRVSKCPGNALIVRMLLDAGMVVDSTARDRNGNNLMNLAALHRSDTNAYEWILSVLEAHFKAGGSANVPSSLQFSHDNRGTEVFLNALAAAIEVNGHPEQVADLLAAYKASGFSDEELATALNEFNNRRDEGGNTFLMRMVMNARAMKKHTASYGGIIAMLLDAGMVIDSTARNRSGNNLMNLAALYRSYTDANQWIYSILEAHFKAGGSANVPSSLQFSHDNDGREVFLSALADAIEVNGNPEQVADLLAAYKASGFSDEELAAALNELNNRRDNKGNTFLMRMVINAGKDKEHTASYGGIIAMLLDAGMVVDSTARDRRGNNLRNLAVLHRSYADANQWIYSVLEAHFKAGGSANVPSSLQFSHDNHGTEVFLREFADAIEVNGNPERVADLLAAYKASGFSDEELAAALNELNNRVDEAGNTLSMRMAIDADALKTYITSYVGIINMFLDAGMVIDGTARDRNGNNLMNLNLYRLHANYELILSALKARFEAGGLANVPSSLQFSHDNDGTEVFLSALADAVEVNGHPEQVADLLAAYKASGFSDEELATALNEFNNRRDEGGNTFLMRMVMNARAMKKHTASYGGIIAMLLDAGMVIDSTARNRSGNNLMNLAALYRSYTDANQWIYSVLEAHFKAGGSANVPSSLQFSHDNDGREVFLSALADAIEVNGNPEQVADLLAAYKASGFSDEELAAALNELNNRRDNRGNTFLMRMVINALVGGEYTASYGGIIAMLLEAGMVIDSTARDINGNNLMNLAVLYRSYTDVNQWIYSVLEVHFKAGGSANVPSSLQFSHDNDGREVFLSALADAIKRIGHLERVGDLLAAYKASRFSDEELAAALNELNNRVDEAGNTLLMRMVINAGKENVHTASYGGIITMLLDAGMVVDYSVINLAGEDTRDLVEQYHHHWQKSDPTLFERLSSGNRSGGGS